MIDLAALKHDLQMLHVKHGINLELIQSLTESPKIARSQIQFFKILMFLFNGTVAVAGFAFIGYSVKNISHTYPIVIILSLLCGVCICIFNFKLFVRQVLAIQEVEIVAKRYNLI